jgi:hypothetical protein
MVEFSKYPTSWEIVLETMTGNIVISGVDVLMCLMLSKAEKYVACGELVGTTKYAAGTAVAQWLRYCATNRKVAGSIPDGVIGIFH